MLGAERFLGEIKVTANLQHPKERADMSAPLVVALPRPGVTLICLL